MRTILQEEGLLRLWRGNLTNVLRVVPYSATQFASYDIFKQLVKGVRKGPLLSSQELLRFV